MGFEIVVLIVVMGLIFDYTNGFHDASNVVSTPIATKIVRPFVAILISSIFNFVGATQISGVATTITSGLVAVPDSSQLMILAAVGGAICWNILTWYFGIPSSSSYALVGGLVGAAWVQGGPEIIIWKNILWKVVVPMIVSPLLGFLLAYGVMKILMAYFPPNSKTYKYCQLGSASVLALSHGLNDAQKSMAIITLGLFTAQVIPSPQIPLWVIGACAVMMALGTLSGGYRIIHTMGYEITKLRPVQGFAVESSAAVVILLASFLGMPISSTHMIAGSITGVGTARGLQAVKWLTAQKLVLVWVLTLPGSGFVASLVFKFLLSIFN